MAPAEKNSPVRNFVTFNCTGVLSTQSRSQPGFPFGSVTPYDVDSSGRIIIWVAKIAEHYRNLTADPHASLFVLEQGGLDDPQPYARATILLKFEPAGDCSETAASYHRRFPAKWQHQVEDSFVFLSGAPVKVRWIGGFGEIRWVDGTDFQAQPHDLIAYHGREICRQMNQVHRAGLSELLQGWPIEPSSRSELPDADTPASMISIDNYGFVLAADNAGNRRFYRLNFPQPAASPDEVPRILISMLERVRSG